jgi:hypothetical protein
MSNKETNPDSSEESPSSPTVQHLTIPFTSRSRHGKIDITLRPNLDPIHAHGLDLIFPAVPQPSFPEQFHGFPVMHGTITYPIPPSAYLSYGNLFGWIQFVRSVSSDTLPGNEEKNEGWEMDIYPYAKDLKSPFVYWGLNPSIFDAPARLLSKDEKVQSLEWRAQSFLCVLEDAGKTKRVMLVPGAGFGWGFDIRAKEGGKGRDITVSDLEVLDVEKAWRGRLGLLRDLYSDWTFLDTTVKG